jgi:hypothetical protein
MGYTGPVEKKGVQNIYYCRPVPTLNEIWPAVLTNNHADEPTATNIIMLLAVWLMHANTLLSAVTCCIK